MLKFNKLFLLGRITADPELKRTPKGMAVANFTIAYDTSFKNDDGTWTNQAEFQECTAYGKIAESFCEKASKGVTVFVEGRTSNRSWTDKDGNKRKSNELVAEYIQIDRPKSETTAPNPAPASTQPVNDDVPF